MALAGCGGADASKEIEKLQSWRATIELARESRVGGWVTPRYARQLDAEAKKAVAASEQATASATPAERDSLSAARGDLRASLTRLERAGR